MKLPQICGALAAAIVLLSCELASTKVLALATSNNSIAYTKSYQINNERASASYQQLIAEALQVVEENYGDSAALDRLNWQQVRSEALSRQYATKEESYTAICSVLTRLGNPATRFLTPEQSTGFLAENSGQPHVGVGLPELLSLDIDEQTQQLRVITPLPNTPAAKAGLKSGDVVVAIAGVLTDGMELGEAAMRLRGLEGSMVTLTIQRHDSTFDVTLERQQINITPTVKAKLIETQNPPIGYITLSQFLESSPQEMRAAIARLSEAKALVLDLRNNPGGAVLAAAEIAGLFLGEAEIGTAVGRANLPPLRSTQTQLVKQPLAVLVNEGTASAAELLAGALQDYQRAVIVGVPTVGKGLVHSIQPLADGSAVVVTLASLRTPNGREILRNGIEPDIVVDTASSPLLDSAIAPASLDDVQYRQAAEQLRQIERGDSSG